MHPYQSQFIGGKMKRFLGNWIILILVIVMAACAPKPVTPATLTIMTHDSFAVSNEIVAKFETENNVKLVFLKSGDAGAALNRAILTKNSPQADVLYGVDNSFLSRAIAEGIFEPYSSPLLSQIPQEFKLAQGNEALPVDYGDVCINYDKAYFSKHNLAIPSTLADLENPIYGKQNGKDGLLVVENPATSSPGLAFLLATVAEFGPDHYLEFWQKLKDNGVVVVNDWATAYYTNFSASTGKGAQPMVVSYASSPAAEVAFAITPLTEAPTASIVGTNSCFRQIEFVGILKGTKNRAMAEKFVDFMLSKEFQEDMPMQNLVYPVNPSAILPPEFVKYSQIPAQPASLSPDVIAANRDAWIQAWTEVVLH
jgi:thiamine transport system substrate-binding protein